MYILYMYKSIVVGMSGTKPTRVRETEGFPDTEPYKRLKKKKQKKKYKYKY